MRARILLLLICISLIFAACTSQNANPEPGQDDPTEPQVENPKVSVADVSTSVFRFYPDENYWTIDPSLSPDEPVEEPDSAPGTLTDAKDIGQPDQSLVNTTVKINLGRLQPCCPFLFYSDQGTERLAVVLRPDEVLFIPMLMIFETDLGVEGLCDALSSEKTFEAKILSMTNLTWEEGMYTTNVVLNLPEEEKYNIVSDVDTVPESGWFVGNFGEDSVEFICGGQNIDDLSTVFKNKLAVYNRIFSRFGLIFP